MGAEISRSSGSGWSGRALACVCALVTVIACLVAPSPAAAQVQTFFVNVPAASEQRDAMELCRDRFTAALVRVGGFRANQDAVTQQSVTDCLGETASVTAKRECEVSMANIEVDFLIFPTVRRLGAEWNWSIKALSPAQGAAQVWGGDGSSVEADAAKAAYGACEGLAKEFACEQGVERACSGSGFGGGPLLGADAGESAEAGAPRAASRRANVSALDVFNVTPTEVAVWIDGKESGTSANQVTGIPPGEHEVTLKATGYFDQSQRVVFEAGKRQVIRGIVLRKTTAALSVSMVEPERAVVLVAGRERGVSGELLTGIAPGETEVVIRAAGYRDRRQSVTFVADTTAKLESLSLESLPATLIVTSNVLGAEVLVDGQVVGETSGGEDLFEVAHTATRMTLRLEGYRSFSKSLKLERGGQTQVRVVMERAVAPSDSGALMMESKRVPPRPAIEPSSWMLWGGVSTGIAATLVMARVCESFTKCEVESESKASTVDGIRIAAITSYVIAAGGLGWRWWSAHKSDANRAPERSVSVVLLPASVAVGVTW